MPQQWPTGVTQIVPRELSSRLKVRWQSLLTHIDRASPNQRKAVALTISLLLHISVLLMLVPSQKGFLSIGTTGLGEVSGAGTAVTLVDTSGITPPQAAQEQAEVPGEDQAEVVTPPVEAEVADTEAPSETRDTAEPAKEQVVTAEQQATPSDSKMPSESTAQATAGAFGKNGESYTDLWNAIAPCWNRITDMNTLPATLTISFNAGGGLDAPPAIERDPAAPITDDSLHAEAKALQALAECGAYPMAKDLQSVTVKFPSAAKVPAPSP